MNHRAMAIAIVLVLAMGARAALVPLGSPITGGVVYTYYSTATQPLLQELWRVQGGTNIYWGMKDAMSTGKVPHKVSINDGWIELQEGQRVLQLDENNQETLKEIFTKFQQKKEIRPLYMTELGTMRPKGWYVRMGQVYEATVGLTALLTMGNDNTPLLVLSIHTQEALAEDKSPEKIAGYHFNTVEMLDAQIKKLQKQMVQ